jgi:hypothetical protein
MATVGAHDRGREFVDRRARQASVAPGDGETRRQAVQIPLPWAAQRLVEVVEVEHQLSGRGREHPEVAQVRVAGQLHSEPGDR